MELIKSTSQAKFDSQIRALDKIQKQNVMRIDSLMATMIPKKLMSMNSSCSIPLDSGEIARFSCFKGKLIRGCLHFDLIDTEQSTTFEVKLIGKSIQKLEIKVEESPLIRNLNYLIDDGDQIQIICTYGKNNIENISVNLLQEVGV